MLNKVNKSVKARTDGRQEPWSHNSGLPEPFPFRAEEMRPAGGFEARTVLEVDRVRCWRSIG